LSIISVKWRTKDSATATWDIESRRENEEAGVGFVMKVRQRRSKLNVLTFFVKRC
jgi:hypothetical protein